VLMLDVCKVEGMTCGHCLELRILDLKHIPIFRVMFEALCRDKVTSPDISFCEMVKHFNGIMGLERTA
jgi:hypothetical protein